MSTRALSLVLLTLLVALWAPAAAFAHGEESDPGTSSMEAEVELLAKQPTRVLAQQAHALIHISGDRDQAAIRLDAALESKDRSDVDMPTLRRATETLDGGGPSPRVIALIDEALSKPFGAESGKLFHGGGREFRPVAATAETVAVIVGALLLALAAAGLWRTRRRPGAAGNAG